MGHVVATTSCHNFTSKVSGVNSHSLFICVFVTDSDEARDNMKREYLDDPNYNYETVNRASKACGPLVQWAIAQV